MRSPAPWTLILLALATYRVWRLVARDEVTHGLRRRVTGVGDVEHAQWAWWISLVDQHGYDAWRLMTADVRWLAEHGVHAETAPYVARSTGPPVGRARWYASTLVRCAWCSGFYLSIITVGAWELAPRIMLVAAVPLAVSALVGLAAQNLDA